MNQTQGPERGDLDPLDVLRSAVDDRIGGRYADALEKLLWFFRNVDSEDLRRKAYRSSYALVELCRLSQIFPNAGIELTRILNEACSNVRLGRRVHTHFQIATAIFRLQRNPRGAERLFLELRDIDNEQAKSVFPQVQHVLIECGNFKVVNEYLDVAMSEKEILESFSAMTDSGLKRESLIQRKWSKIVTRAWNIVAIYAMHGRDKDAAYLVDRIQGVICERGNPADAENALKGRLVMNKNNGEK